MIDASEIVNNLVAMLRDVPALVAEVGNDATRIYAYHDSYPKNVSLAHALHQMASPSIMVVWQGTQPGSFGGVDVWKHQITLFLRAKEETTVGTAYYRLFRLIVKGVPTGAGIVMLNATVHTSCYPMDLPTIQRQTDAEGLDSVVSGYRIGCGSEVSSIQQLDGCFGLPRFEFPFRWELTRRGCRQ